MAPPIMNVAEAQRIVLTEVERARCVVGFTGAGISTECGVPDFRTPGSPWMANKPVPFSAFLASDVARREAWRRKFAMDDSYNGARPGRGHKALTHLVRIGKSPAVITQNIDNLHQASGLAEHEVIELHGNGTYASCLGCALRYELPEVRRRFEQSGEPPHCDACGGFVKSATISFGQPMPGPPMRAAHSLAMQCDLLLAIGSSLVVHPAAGIPALAQQAGARLVIINREPTPLDPIADVVIRADIGDVVEPLLHLSSG
jgi:NAD-dependent deacetylase